MKRKKKKVKGKKELSERKRTNIADKQRKKER